MTELEEVRLEIEAVEFALQSYAFYEEEKERRDFLRQNFSAVPGLATYLGYSEDKLQDEKKQLQDYEIKLQDEKWQLQEKERQLREENIKQKEYEIKLLEYENLLLARERGLLARERGAGGGQTAGFAPQTTIYEILVKSIPDSLLPTEEDKSCHASTMFNSKEVIPWFRENLVMPREWELEHPHDIIPNSSNKLPDYFSALRSRGYKEWKIENKQHATSYLKVRSQSTGDYITIGGRADYLITKDSVTVAEYLSKILCVIKIESKASVELCELQMHLYLLILMNAKHLPALVGFLVCKDGLCRAFKATRDESGGCLFEMDDLFHVCHLCDVMVEVLRDVDLIDT